MAIHSFISPQALQETIQHSPQVHPHENWKLYMGSLEAPRALNARDSAMLARPINTTQTIPIDAFGLRERLAWGPSSWPGAEAQPYLTPKRAHAGHCSRSVRMQRHNAIRNFLAHHARCSEVAVH